ncbi:MAG: AAA family ATPase [Candidatus Heimdallarchaeota archaeon]|nr:AAA family ATPase [Candidatus Heimdallarchaeota archaeon]
MDNGNLISVRESNTEFLCKGKVLHLYGPPKSGKSTLSATIAFELAKHDLAVSIISTERPIEIRMQSMIEAESGYTRKLLETISTSDIFTFDDLIHTLIHDLPTIELEMDMIIIDSLTSAYRQHADPISLTLLRKALSSLQSLAINRNIAVMYTNQVASTMKSNNDFRPVASASTRSYSDITTRLTRKSNESTEITFEDLNGEELEVLEPFTITALGIEEFDQLFQVLE